MAYQSKSDRVRFVTKLLFITLAFASLVHIAHAASYRLDRVEPPNWWVGFKDETLQLLVYGKNIADLRPVIRHRSVKLVKTQKVKNRNYLFLHLNIGKETRPGTVKIEFYNKTTSELRKNYVLARKNPDPRHTKGFTAADTIYLITPDRFANGTTANDNVPNGQDRVNRQALHGRHGGDLQGISDHLSYIESMGFTAIWLNPLLENRQDESSYHGYATTDFYRVDPRFGDNEEYRDLVQSAKKMGLGIMMDMITNHSGHQHWWRRDVPTDDWYNNQQRFVRTSHHHTANIDRYAAQVDKKAFTDGWFERTMPDINQRNPLVGQYFIQNALWWIEYLGLKGIRVDTYSYSDKEFMAQWTARIMREYPQLNIVGTEKQLNPIFLAYWQMDQASPDGYRSHLSNVMDFPLQATWVNALMSDEHNSLQRVYALLAADIVYPHPENLVIFPDNHNMNRIYTQVKYSEDLYKMTMAFFLTMRGIPQIYYGTEILMHNRNSDALGAIRGDFPGAATDASSEKLSTSQLRAQQFMKKLLRWRKSNEVIHKGKFIHFVPQNNTYVYFRYINNRKVMVAFNKNTQWARLPAARFAEQIGRARNGQEIIGGTQFLLTGTIDIPPVSAVIVEFDADQF